MTLLPPSLALNPLQTVRANAWGIRRFAIEGDHSGDTTIDLEVVFGTARPDLVDELLPEVIARFDPFGPTYVVFSKMAVTRLVELLTAWRAAEKLTAEQFTAFMTLIGTVAGVVKGPDMYDLIGEYLALTEANVPVPFRAAS